MSKQTQDKELVTVKPPEGALVASIDMSAYAGMGLENINADKLSFPWLKVIQGNSPETKSKNEKYIPGAKEGMIVNSLTGALHDGEKGIDVVICSIQERELEWAPRNESMGRPVVSYPASLKDAIPAFTWTTGENNKMIRLIVNGKGNYLVETDEYYVLQINEDGFGEPGIVAMDSTDLGCSRRIKSQIFSRMLPGGKGKVPIFGQIYNLSVVDGHSDEFDWKKWKATFVGMITSTDLFEQALQFHKAVEPRQLEIVRNQLSSQAAATNTEGQKVPF